jgi:hypothetical protein
MRATAQLAAALFFAGIAHAGDAWPDSPNKRFFESLPEDRIVADYAPDGQGHLFMARAPDLIFGGPDFVTLLCFVRPKGGL